MNYFFVLHGQNNVVTSPAESNRQRCLNGIISNTHHSFGELLRWILQAFSLEDTGKTRAQLHQIFVDYLIGQYAKNRRTMLIIDEAQNMSSDALEELRMLSNINSKKIGRCK